MALNDPTEGKQGLPGRPVKVWADAGVGLAPGFGGGANLGAADQRDEKPEN